MVIVASGRLLIDSVGFTLPVQHNCRVDGNFGKIAGPLSGSRLRYFVEMAGEI